MGFGALQSGWPKHNHRLTPAPPNLWWWLGLGSTEGLFRGHVAPLCLNCMVRMNCRRCISAMIEPVQKKLPYLPLFFQKFLFSKRTESAFKASAALITSHKFPSDAESIIQSCQLDFEDILKSNKGTNWSKNVLSSAGSTCQAQGTAQQGLKHRKWLGFSHLPCERCPWHDSATNLYRCRTGEPKWERMGNFCLDWVRQEQNLGIKMDGETVMQSDLQPGGGLRGDSGTWLLKLGTFRGNYYCWLSHSQFYSFISVSGEARFSIAAGQTGFPKAGPGDLVRRKLDFAQAKAKCCVLMEQTCRNDEDCSHSQIH